MVKIVVKKEGATQTCGKCGTDLICRMKEYAKFPPSLQWQNYDGAAHFKTSDGVKYSCNVPDKEEAEQTRISTEIPSQAPPVTTPGDSPPPTSINLSIINTLDEIKLNLQRVDEMVQAIFRYTVDEQLKKSSEVEKEY